MTFSRRDFLKAGGVFVVGASLAPSLARAQTIPNADRFLGKPLEADRVDAFLAIHADGSVTLFSGKVDMAPAGASRCARSSPRSSTSGPSASP